MTHSVIAPGEAGIWLCPLDEANSVISSGELQTARMLARQIAGRDRLIEQETFILRAKQRIFLRAGD